MQAKGVYYEWSRWRCENKQIIAIIFFGRNRLKPENVF